VSGLPTSAESDCRSIWRHLPGCHAGAPVQASESETPERLLRGRPRLDDVPATPFAASAPFPAAAARARFFDDFLAPLLVAWLAALPATFFAEVVVAFFADVVVAFLADVPAAFSADVVVAFLADVPAAFLADAPAAFFADLVAFSTPFATAPVEPAPFPRANRPRITGLSRRA